MTFKTKMKQWLFGVCAAVAVGLTADPSTAQAQTYVRPSKGTPVAVFPGGTTPTVSNVYDMSAFVEAQLDVTMTQGSVDYPISYSVTNLTRYIKFSVGYQNAATDRYIQITVLGADNPAGPFNTVNAPTAVQVLRPAPSGGSITSVKLNMTPLPYSTIQYTRPQKGLPIVVFDGKLPAIGTLLPAVSVNVTGFAAVSLKVDVANLPGGCLRDVIVRMYDGVTLGENRIVEFPVQENDGSVAVNVNSRFVNINAYVTSSSPLGGDCTYTITATPLPYTVSANKVSFDNRTNIWSVGTATTAQVGFGDFTRTTMILTNIGDYPVRCHSSDNVALITNQSGIVLGGSTAAGRADGGRIELKNFIGPVYCLAFGGSSSVASFQY